MASRAKRRNTVSSIILILALVAGLVAVLYLLKIPGIGELRKKAAEPAGYIDTFPVSNVDAASQVMNPYTKHLQAVVVKGGQYWGFECNTFTPGNPGIYSFCYPKPVEVQTLANIAAIAGHDTVWNSSFPTDRIDAMTQVFQGYKNDAAGKSDWIFRTNVFKDGGYWGYECSYNADTSAVHDCAAKAKGTFTDLSHLDITGSVWQGTFPTDRVDAVTQYTFKNGDKLRTNVFKGGTYWGYECDITHRDQGGITKNCAATVKKSLGDLASLDTTGAVWNHTFPASVDAVSQYEQPDGALRTNVFKDGNYWGFNCKGNNCSAVVMRTLREVLGDVQTGMNHTLCENHPENADECEPNDDFYTAKLAKTGMTYVGHMGADEEDYFRLDLKQGQNVHVVLTPVAALTSKDLLQIQLFEYYGEDKKHVVGFDALAENGQFELSYKVSVPGRYYIRVATTKVWDSSSAYTLKIE